MNIAPHYTIAIDFSLHYKQLKYSYFVIHARCIHVVGQTLTSNFIKKTYVFNSIGYQQNCNILTQKATI